MLRALILLVLLPALAFAQDFKGYRDTTLDAILEDWSSRTKNEQPGLSLSSQDKMKFVVRLHGPPVACNNGALKIVLMMINMSDLLEKVSITHCVWFQRGDARPIFAYVQDVLVPGLNSDVEEGQSVQIYADMLAYSVNADQSRNAPIMLVNRFEPIARRSGALAR